MKDDIEAELFAPEELRVTEKPERKEKCEHCKHIQRWRNEFASPSHAVNYYCGIRCSNRTINKLLKIKRKTAACDAFEEAE
jgi:hypothetical protein